MFGYAVYHIVNNITNFSEVFSENKILTMS